MTIRAEDLLDADSLPHPRARVGFSVARGLGGLLSRLICWASGSKASHAWILYWDPFFRQEFVLEAHETGFRSVPLRTFKQSNRIVRIANPKVSIDAGVRVLGAFVGQRYDFLGLFGMIWVELAARFRKRARNPFRSTRALFCTEAVAKALIAADYPGMKNVDPETVDPAFLWALFDEKEP